MEFNVQVMSNYKLDFMANLLYLISNWISWNEILLVSKFNKLAFMCSSLI